MCQMIFTSDQAFFYRIGKNETKRYFDECYKFIYNYKNLGEKNIISAVVHLDEGAPHMHLMFVPVVHTKDQEGKNVDKICARDFWKGRDSYRKLQDAYFNHVKFYETVEKFIHWVCHKFGIGESKELIKRFEDETNTYLDPEKQLGEEEYEKEWDLEL